MLQSMRILLTGIMVICSSSLFATTIFVKTGGSGNGTSWLNAFGSLHDAIAAANAGDEIWIAQGTYIPGNSRNTRFVLKGGIKLYGGFAGTETSLSQRDSTLASKQVIISGEIQNDGVDSNNSLNLLYARGLSQPVHLNSLIVSDAYTNTQSLAYLGAIHMHTSTVYLTNIEVRNNKGGLYLGSNSLYTPILCFKSNVFIDNANVHHNIGNNGGGIFIDYDQSTSSTKIKVKIQNSSFSNNTATYSGGGINARLDSQDSLFIENSVIENNEAMYHGGGIWSSAPALNSAFCSLSKVKLIGNTILPTIGNSGGGMSMVYTKLLAHDILVADNVAAGSGTMGAGIFLDAASNATFINSSFANNRLIGQNAFGGNQFYIGRSSGIKFDNCIIDTVQNEHYMYPDFSPHPSNTIHYSSNVTFRNCLFGGSLPFWIDGGNNIQNTTPGFIASYALDSSSAAIDAGNNTFRNVNYIDDLMGNPRISNGLVDIGCYEFIKKDEPTDNTNITSAFMEKISIYPNPAREYLSIKGASSIDFEVYSMLGQKMLQGKIRDEQQNINIMILNKGVYIIRLSTKEGNQGAVKFIKE